jgi:hypothetical protein
MALCGAANRGGPVAIVRGGALDAQELARSATWSEAPRRWASATRIATLALSAVQ